MEEDNNTKQTEEVGALESIYGNEFTIDSEISRSYTIKVKERKMLAWLSVTFPSYYPSEGPPKYILSCPEMDRNTKEKLIKDLDQLYISNVGEPVVYQWVEKIRETLQRTMDESELKKKGSKKGSKAAATPAPPPAQEPVPCPQIVTGKVLEDRKSHFQGHVAVVKSIDEVKIVLSKLMENKKVANATHNMYAYCVEVAGVRHRDNSDDGEMHAGARLMHLMELLNLSNTLVVVSRWFGGVLLGPERFRLINNAARSALEAAGMVPPPLCPSNKNKH